MFPSTPFSVTHATHGCQMFILVLSHMFILMLLYCKTKVIWRVELSLRSRHPRPLCGPGFPVCYLWFVFRNFYLVSFPFEDVHGLCT